MSGEVLGGEDLRSGVRGRVSIWFFVYRGSITFQEFPCGSTGG